MKRFLIAAVLLTVALPLGTVAARTAHSTPSAHTAILAPLALAQRDQQGLAAARPDARNLYDLTRRLKLHSLASINPYVRSTAPNYAVGRVDTFWVAQATSGYFSLKAKLLLKTPHAYWYVQDNMGIPQARLMAALRISAHDFETHVYPTDHAAFGREWTPGVDHDPRITVLCANLPGVGGYYSAEDLYPRSVNPFSNQRKMLYVNITAFALGTPDFDWPVAHELQHMIPWYQHERDDTWCSEGSGVLARGLTGYTPDGQDQAFAADPGTQLDDFCYGAPDCSDGDAYAHYGAAFLWMYYLYQHYGGDRAMRAVLADKSLSGMALFDDVLARLGSRDSALTRALDLRHVRHATLQYDIWYAVEKDFDYGYVEVSTDGGRTWYTVHGRSTTNANPNGSNYGNGYTGYSVKKAGNHSGWLHESIDLSPYAGHRILLRFEHITDDAFNLAGLTLDNIRVPEIGFVDGPGTSGWQTHGWVRVANVLPTHWLVQLALYTPPGAQVRQLPPSATARRP